MRKRKRDQQSILRISEALIGKGSVLRRKWPTVEYLREVKVETKKYLVDLATRKLLVIMENGFSAKMGIGAIIGWDHSSIHSANM